MKLKEFMKKPIWFSQADKVVYFYDDGSEFVTPKNETERRRILNMEVSFYGSEIDRETGNVTMEIYLEKR